MFLSGLFRAATPENPRFSLNDPEAWDTFLAGNPSATGVRVTRELALTYAPWWRGVNLVSATAAKLPVEVKFTSKGKRNDTDHPAWPLLRRKANEYQTAFQFKQLMFAHALQIGNGFAHIDRLGGGRPDALVPLNPEDVTPAREDGVPLYLVRVAGEALPRKVPADEIFHLRGFNFDGLTGYSVYDKARESLGLGMALRKYGAVFFRNDARPNVVIELPQKQTEKQLQEYRRVWNSLHSGLENQHRVALLHGGAQLKPYQVVARDAQMLESRQFEIREIALWIGVPAHKLGDSSKAAYNSLEQENQDYLDDSIDPWLVRFEEEAWDKLLTEEEKADETHEVQFDRKKLVRADIGARGTYYQKATGNRPWQTPDEVREEEGLEPIGGEAAELKDPLNVGPEKPAEDDGGAKPAKPRKNAGTPPADEKEPGAFLAAIADLTQALKREAEPTAIWQAHPAAARIVAQDGAGRAIRRLGHAAAAAARKPAKFNEFLDGLAGEHRAALFEILTPAAAIYAVDPMDMANTIAEEMRQAFLAAAGEARNAEDLEREVKRITKEKEQTGPAALVSALEGKQS